MMYKAFIRNMWNKYQAQMFFMIKREKQLEKQAEYQKLHNNDSPPLSPENSPK